MALLQGCRTAGVSGSRAPSPTSLSACRLALAALPLHCQVITGCAAGIDQAARQFVPSSRLSVFRASAFGRGAWAFAARSTAAVQAVAAGGAGASLWLSFPASPCPAGLLPTAHSRRAFSGRGSGTWASLAFALGLGVPALVFLPAGVPAPAGWPLTPIAGAAGWYRFSPSAVQGSLF